MHTATGEPKLDGSEADGSRAFRPYDMIARADMAAFLHRMDQKDLVNLK